MKLLLVTHYWPPEYGPDPPILYETARYLQSKSIEVAVVAALPSYPSGIVPPEYRNTMFRWEDIGGVPTLRTWTYSGPRERTFSRVVNQLSFDASCLMGALPFQRYDWVVAVTPPLTLIPASWMLSKLLRARYMLHVMDLHPEAAVSVSFGKSSRMVPVLRQLARFGYARASAIVAASREIKAGIEKHGVPPAKVHFVPNGIDTKLFRPMEPEAEPDALVGPEDGSSLAVFAGTMGRTHDVESILRVSELLQREGRWDWRFLLVGAGGEKRRALQVVERQGLRNVRILDPIPREQLPRLLARADAVLVMMRNIDITRTMIPTKLYDAMACGRPVILGTEGEARRILEEAEAGIAIAPEDPSALLSALETLRADPSLGARLGKNGRQYALAHFARERCAEQLCAILEQNLAQG